jgi:hypothetical protein
MTLHHHQAVYTDGAQMQQTLQQPLQQYPDPNNGYLQQQQQQPTYANGQQQPPLSPDADHICNCGGDPTCCAIACLLPSAAYGYNYSLARQQPAGACCFPCMSNTALDCLPYAVLSVVLSSLHAPAVFATFPLGCLCRAQHRYSLFGAPDQFPRIIQMSEREHWLESLAIETLCWGCSLAQIHSRLLRRRQERSGPPIPGNDLIGILHAPPSQLNSMSSATMGSNGYAPVDYNNTNNINNGYQPQYT